MHTHAEPEGAPLDASEPEQDELVVGRELGEQPITLLMAEHGVKPSDLVAASTEQLTHKMVTRALKGRRLTPKAMGKVHRAMEQAAAVTYPRHELFNYNP